jgi:zinc transporter
MAAITDRLAVADLRSSGRLWAFAFQAGSSAAPLGEIEAAPETADWVWEHFALSDHRSRLRIERAEEIPETVRASLLGGETRVQVRADGDWTFGVLPDLEHELEGDAPGACRVHFAFDGRQLITTRRHALQVIDTVRREIERGEGALAAPADAVALHVARFIDATEARLAGLSAQLDHAEDQVLSEYGNIDNLRLGPIRRELSTRHREFVALRSAFHRASSHRNAGKAGALSERVPPLLQEIEDFDRDLAGLQDRAKLVHDEIEAKLSAAANRSLRVLTILSTLLLPPTLIVGAFGMNVRGIPFAEQGVGFWSASILCVLVVGLCYWALKQLRIL